MKAVVDIIKSNSPLNDDEYSIIECIFYAIASIIFLIIISIVFWIKGQFAEWIDSFTYINSVSVLLFLWILFLIYKFLHGYLYIKRFHEAVKQGKHFKGMLIEQQLFRYGGSGFRYLKYQPIVELDNGELVRAPKYNGILVAPKNCDVYLYKKKYYFVFHFKEKWNKH